MSRNPRKDSERSARIQRKKDQRGKGKGDEQTREKEKIKKK